MMIEAKVIEDSVSAYGKRILTLQLVYPRFIHAEFMTHRMFSRNASSSRAIPVKKMIEQVRENPAMPIHWGANQAGMQAHSQLEGANLAMVQQLWLEAARKAADFADAMQGWMLHKQVANRILEPFQHIHVVVTATEWQNFFDLRLHPDAQPEIHELARVMKQAIDGSWPKVRPPVNEAIELENESNWHLPYITAEERARQPLENLLKMSTARCARVSYMKHDGDKPSLREDLELYDRLVGNDPKHASPCEHQARASLQPYMPSRNFYGWMQHRELIER